MNTNYSDLAQELSNAMIMQNEMLIKEFCRPPKNGCYDSYDQDGNETIDYYENGKLVLSYLKRDL